MKSTELFLVLAILSASLQLTAQEEETEGAFYTYEIIPTGNLSESNDSLFSVTLILDTADLRRYTIISLENSQQKEQMDVSIEAIKDNPRIQRSDRNYKLDMMEWKMLEESRKELCVYGLKPDGSMVKLRKHPRGSEFYHKVYDQILSPGDLKVYVSSEISEEKSGL